MTSVLKSLGLVVLLAALAQPAFAQISTGGGPGGGGIGGGSSGRGGGPNLSGGGGDDKKPAEKPQEPPSPIPGATANPDTVVPADKSAGELAPNEALFDAITRGDISSARDALNRGAQLDSHNVLGQTPTEASIDLNRNDITFLLLSMRGGPQSHSRQAVSAHAIEAKATKKATLRPQRPMPSSDRGQPNPAAGFIGF